MATHKTFRPLDQENSMRQMLLPKDGMGKTLSLEGEFLSPTVGKPLYANTMLTPKLQNSV